MSTQNFWFQIILIGYYLLYQCTIEISNISIQCSVVCVFNLYDERALEELIYSIRYTIQFLDLCFLIVFYIVKNDDISFFLCLIFLNTLLSIAILPYKVLKQKRKCIYKYIKDENIFKQEVLKIIKCAIRQIKLDNI